MSEIIENAYITDYHLEFKEGKLTLHIGLDGKGWGCYYSGELQGTKPIFDLLDALKIHELDELNDVALVRVRHNGVGSKITAIGDIVEDRWFSFPAPETSACDGDCKNCDNPPLTVADLYKLYEDPDNDGHVWISLDGCIFPAILDVYSVDGKGSLVAVWCASTEKESWLWEKDYGTTWVAYPEKPVVDCA